MLKPLVLIALLIAGPAAATQEYILPTLFDVAGVAADDILNIRAAPSVSAPVIGVLASDATGVEVTAQDASGRWGQVNAGERAGWVAMRFLNYRSDVWQAGTVPEGFSCAGTEPFWGFRLVQGGLVWEEPDHRITLSGAQILDSGVFRDPSRAILVEDDHDLLMASVTPKQCSDGMSDMAYGLEATVILQSRDQPARMYRGCCRIAPPR
ncbi:MAG TPA: SH3 domain-containing protein [Paracoccus sp. (in: a-proteobacteria)]|uniref:COG3650 family protein n=1 Tax=uncultured Paracoccus sp. TaxID=189685 RepID=UPI00260A1960|nr:SH3 domain-containing protein [uncultured Paracoccus sp.]HMQ40483.1 SH3 domain-containing protein [Paracoccus sp. (in: a-proteobacteria)]HMR34976.1 SH3 domain-containing protein [Paracoccus sp. (in: a-proteobacteria)]